MNKTNPPEKPRAEHGFPGGKFLRFVAAALLASALLAATAQARYPQIFLPGEHLSSVISIAFSPDGQILATAFADSTVKLWQVAGGRQLKTLSGHTEWVYSIAFSPDGRLLASGSIDNSVKIWDVSSGRELRALSGHSSFVRSVAFSPDGFVLASASQDQTVKLWLISNGRELNTLYGHYGMVNSIAFSPDGQILASASVDNTPKLWDVSSGKELRTLSGHSSAVLSVAFSPDGRILATASMDTTVKNWDVTSGSVVRSLSGHSDWVKSVAFSPDGRLLASGSADKTVKLWDVAGGRELKTLLGHSGPVYSVAFSPDGRLLASGSADGTTRLWDIQGGRELVRLHGLADGGWISLTPQGYYSASYFADRLLNARTGPGLREVEGIENWREKFNRPDKVAEALSLSPRGRQTPRTAPQVTTKTLPQGKQSRTSVPLAERDPAVVIPVSSLGQIQETQKQIVYNSLLGALSARFRLIPQDRFEQAQEAAFQELDYEECTDAQCIVLIQQILQVVDLFALQLVRDGADTQITLQWIDLDARRVKTSFCADCDTRELNEAVGGLLAQLLENR